MPHSAHLEAILGSSAAVHAEWKKAVVAKSRCPRNTIIRNRLEGAHEQVIDVSGSIVEGYIFCCQIALEPRAVRVHSVCGIAFACEMNVRLVEMRMMLAM